MGKNNQVQLFLLVGTVTVKNSINIIDHDAHTSIIQEKPDYSFFPKNQISTFQGYLLKIVLVSTILTSCIKNKHFYTKYPSYASILGIIVQWRSCRILGGTKAARQLAAWSDGPLVAVSRGTMVDFGQRYLDDATAMVIDSVVFKLV